MSDAASDALKYDNWTKLVYKQLEDLEQKWHITIPASVALSSNVMKARLENLEYNLGVKPHRLSSIDERLFRLGEVPEEQVTATRRIKIVEDAWHIISYHPQSLGDRIAQIVQQKNIKLISALSEYGKVSILLKLMYDEEDKMKTSGEVALGPKRQEAVRSFEGDKPTLMFKDSDPKGLEDQPPSRKSYIDTPRDIANKVSIDESTYLDKFHKLVEECQGNMPVDMKNILSIMPHILKLQAQKAAVYGRSYARHGDLSIFLNTERKWDRISNIMDKAMQEGTEHLYETGTATETFVDTVVDLASYSLLWLGYIRETHPEAWDKFVDTNKLSLD